MDLRLAVVTTSENFCYRACYWQEKEDFETRRSGPLTSLRVDPEKNQLVVVDANIQPPEIVHVCPESGPENLSVEKQNALEEETFPGIIAAHTPPEKPLDPSADSRYMSWTGLAAQVWDPSGGDQPQKDHDYIKTVIESNGGPALDVGCGTGRLLLRYRAAGLDVDGLDSSGDILAICREKANRQELQVNLYQQSMHEINLPRQYQTLFIPCGTFCLLINRGDAFQALAGMYDHLLPGGELIFNLFWEYGPGGLYWKEQDGKWHRMFYNELADGKLVFQYMQTERMDRVEQQYYGRRRYQLVEDGQVVREEIFPSYERLYGKYEIQMMLQQVGFRDVIVTGDWASEPFREGHEVMVIRGRK